LIGKKVWHPGFSFLLQPLSTLFLLNGTAATESAKVALLGYRGALQAFPSAAGQALSHNFSRNCSCFYPVVAVPYCQSKEY